MNLVQLRPPSVEYELSSVAVPKPPASNTRKFALLTADSTEYPWMKL